MLGGVCTCDFASESGRVETPARIYYKTEHKQLCLRWCSWNGGVFLLLWGGPWWHLPHGARMGSLRAPGNPGQAQAGTSATSRTALGRPCSLPALCRRRDWGQRAVFPLVDSGMTFRHLRPTEGCLQSCTATWVSVPSWGGVMSKNAECPPRPMWFLLVSQRFSYSLLLKPVP